MSTLTLRSYERDEIVDLVTELRSVVAANGLMDDDLEQAIKDVLFILEEYDETD